ncbi:MAG: ABC transporter permease, partial [Halobacteriaceae archaeon]
LGLILILIFGVYLGWVHVIPPANRTFFETVKFLTLPAITLGTASAALLTRMIRNSMLEVINKDYIRTARAFGLPERTVIIKHVLRNGFIPVITLLGLQIAFMVNGAVVIEKVFAWPGMGRLLINAINARNIRMIQGITLVVAVGIVFVNLIVDIIYAFIDPRIRY